jgi:hypothetical protein
MTTIKAKKAKTTDQDAVDVPNALDEVIKLGVERRRAEAAALRLAADRANAAQQDGADDDIDIDGPGMRVFDPVRIEIWQGVDDHGEEIFRIDMTSKGDTDVISVQARSHAKALKTASKLARTFYRAALLPIRDHSYTQKSPHFTGSLERLHDETVY